MTSRERFEAWWEQEKYDDKLNCITGIMFNRIKANMFLSWQASEEAMAVQLANAESKCRELATELSAVDKIHNEAVFITDDHYEQCPPEVQKMIRSLAVLQIPACDAFLAEVRASARDNFIDRIEWIIRNECNPDKTEAIISELQKFSDELKLEAAQ